MSLDSHHKLLYYSTLLLSPLSPKFKLLSTAISLSRKFNRIHKPFSLLASLPNSHFIVKIQSTATALWFSIDALQFLSFYKIVTLNNKARIDKVQLYCWILVCICNLIRQVQIYYVTAVKYRSASRKIGSFEEKEGFEWKSEEKKAYRKLVRMVVDFVIPLGKLYGWNDTTIAAHGVIATVMQITEE